jgi:hypothetical protein
MALIEKTYTLINEDEVMVDFNESGEASIVYVYVDSKPSTFRWLGIDPSDIGRYLSTSGAFITATDVNKAWEAVQRRAITMEVE